MAGIVASRTIVTMLPAPSLFATAVSCAPPAQSSLEAAHPVPHLVLPFASSSDEACQALLPTLVLPNLTRLLSLANPPRGLPATSTPSTAAPANAADFDPELTLTPPHEWVLAQALGLVDITTADLAALDGRLPWAAAMSRPLLASPDTPAAWFSPCHQEVGTGQVTLHPPATLGLSDAHSQALMAALQPLALEDGIRLHWVAADRWLAQGPTFASLPSASLDRVAGRSIAGWLSSGPAAAGLRRLQSEAQMLYYNHPANDEREAQRLAPVNAFWISGSGACPPGARHTAPELVVPQTLRTAALQGHWAGWQQAWQTLDAEVLPAWLDLARRGQPLRITLCGERSSLSFDLTPRSAWQGMRQKISGFFTTLCLTNLLNQL